MGGVKVKTGDFENMLGIDAGSDFSSLSLGTAVAPDDSVHKGIAFLVDGNDGVVDSIKADSADLCGVNAGGLEQFLNDLLEGVDPVSRDFFSPGGEGVNGIVCSACLCDKLALSICQEALHTLSTKVNTNNVHKRSPFKL